MSLRNATRSVLGGEGSEVTTTRVTRSPESSEPLKRLSIQPPSGPSLEESVKPDGDTRWSRPAINAINAGPQGPQKKAGPESSQNSLATGPVNHPMGW